MAAMAPIPSVGEILERLGSYTQDHDFASDAPAQESPELEPEVESLCEKGEFSEAAELTQRLVKVRERDYGPTHWSTRQARQLLEGVEAFTSLNEEDRSRLIEAMNLDKKVQRLFEGGAFGEAIQVGVHQVISLTELIGDRHRLVAEKMRNLAAGCWWAGKKRAAGVLFREFVSRSLQTHGIGHAAIVPSINDLAHLLFTQSDMKQAVALRCYALSLELQTLGYPAEDIATSANNLATLLQDTDDVEAAESLFRQCLAIRRKVLPADHRLITTSVNNLGVLMQRMNRFEPAEQSFREALTRHRRAPGTSPSTIAQTEANLAVTLLEQGKYHGAKERFQTALELHDPDAPDKVADLAATYQGFASLLYRTGHLVAAEKMALRSQATFARLYGANHVETCASTITLGGVQVGLGDLTGAEHSFKEAADSLRIQELAPGQLAVALRNLGQVRLTRRDFAGADEALGEAIKLSAKRFGEDSGAVAFSRIILGHLYKAQGLTAKADAEYTEAQTTLERRFGRAHPEVANAMHYRAILAQERGDFEGAEELQREALRIEQLSLGDGAYRTASTTLALGKIAWARENLDEVEDLIGQACDISERVRRAATLPQNRLDYFRRTEPFHLIHAAVLLQRGDKTEAWRAADRHLGRGLLDSLLQAEANRFSEEESMQERRLRERVTNLDRLLNTFLGRPGPERDEAVQADDIRRRLAEARADWIDHQERMATQYPIQSGRGLPLGQIQHQLSSERAIVGWVDFPRQEWPGGRPEESWAYVIRSAGAVQWFKLQRAGRAPAQTEHDQTLPRQFRDALARRAPEYENLASRLAGQRLAPLTDVLEGIRHVIVVAAGSDMLGVPIGALTDAYTVSYAPSATLYAWLRENRRPWSKGSLLLAMGDPPFNDTQLASMQRQVAVGRPVQMLALARSAALDDEALMSATRGDCERRRLLSRLPGTRYEVLAISKAFSTSSIYLGEDASEQNLVDLLRADRLQDFRYIHFATHGIADSDQPMYSSIMLSQVNLPDPWKAATDDKRIYDGGLEMGEVLREWRGKLRAELVTISACRSALGRRAGGEGHMGFAQAFLLAGAQNLVLSLWDVDDASTTLLMTRFYENLSRMSLAEAVAEAKRYVRGLTLDELIALSKDVPEMREMCETWQKRRKRQKEGSFRPYEHPYYWAPFILIGEGGREESRG